jgi:dipeptidyl aminopeptidase/acylaminoacyl peptidase
VPNVETGDEQFRWRHAWIYDLTADTVRQVGSCTCNVWEAAWCGNNALAAVMSPGPGEGLWYSARLYIVNVADGSTCEIYSPRYQLGWPCGSPEGDQVAVVEAICSDRWFVAGELRIVNTQTGSVRSIDTAGTDITHTEWRSDRRLLLAGHRGFETVVGRYDADTGHYCEVWSSAAISTGGRYITVSGLGENGDCALVGESFQRAPEIAVIRGGEYRAVRSLGAGYAEHARCIRAAECVRWNASDGLEIHGWLLRPRSDGPHPLIMIVHGGPVWQWRPTWLGRGGLSLLMLLQRGYALFLPNPRGSSGRGTEFARGVLGDMGGADTHDLLFGLDHLVRQGIADPKRLGVTGGSYGGFMSAWLITQDTRFAAAVPVAPVTNQLTEHLISNIPHFVQLFLADDYTNAGGRYFERSPVVHARRVRTPTLSVCGALDRCTPPEEAVQFHNALLENGVKSVLVTYPEEGHGVRKLPAVFDYTARVVNWFEENMH